MMTENKRMFSKRQASLLLALSLAISAFAVTGTSAVASADDEKEGQAVEHVNSLKDQPAVRKMRQYRSGRILLEPTLSFTLQDEYANTFFIGLKAQYHFTDWLGVGVFGQFGAAAIDTDLTDQISSKGNDSGSQNDLSFPNRRIFPDQIGKWQWNAGLQLDFIPLRGKLAIFQKLFVDTDFHIFAGVAVVGVEERKDVAASTLDPSEVPSGIDTAPANDCDPLLDTHDEASCSALGRSTRVTVAPTFGAGLSLYFNDWVGLNLEWRGFLFSWNTSGTDEGSSNGDFPDQVVDADDRIFRLNHMFTVGVTFLLPVDAEISE